MTEEKRINLRIDSSYFISLNRLKMDFYDANVSDVLMRNFFPHPEGYVKATATSIGTNPTYDFNYVYNYTDHLGNVRVSYAKDPQTGNLKILDESHYYPYGLKHQSYSSSGFIRNPYGDVIIAPVTNNPYKYKYNGKELQDELGLNMYNMDMRMYDPAIARWVVMDPVIHHTMSPYNAFDLNPVFWADPSGAEGESNNSSSDTESGGGSTPGAIGTDRYGNQTLNIGYGVNISAGTAAISVNNYGSSTGGKRNNTSARAKGNSSNSASNNSDFDWSSVTFEGGDPNAVELDEVSFSGNGIDAAMMQGVNQAENYINAWNSLNGNVNRSGFDQWMFGIGAGATALEHTPGTFRLGTATRYISPKYYGNGWGGNQYAKTFNIGKIGRLAGYAGFGAGVAMDGIGLVNGTTSWGKAGLNTTMGAIGNFGGPYGMAVGTAYGGLEAFYPGGANGFFQDGNGYQGSLNSGFNQAGPYNINLVGAHESK